jgi:hypothetical protein
MTLLQKILTTLVGVFSLSSQAGSWPPLPKTGFIVGQAATNADVDAGNAAFVAAINGVSIGVPIKITIPQYAYYKENGKKLPVIVIQAEEAQGQKLVGARQINGQDVVGLIADFELLGSVQPK